MHVDDCYKLLQEQWSQWRPAPGVAGGYEMKFVDYQDGILKIGLVEDKLNSHEVLLTFVQSVVAYRDSNESFRFRQRTWVFDTADKDASSYWSLFQVHDGELAMFVHARSGMQGEEAKLFQMAIGDSEFLFEVVATRMPTVDVTVLDQAAFDTLCSKPRRLLSTLYDVSQEGPLSSERWVRWLPPLAELSGQYTLERVFTGVNQEELILAAAGDRGRRISISFDCLMGQHRLMRIDLAGAHYRKYDLGEWAFFKVENSQYLQWVRDESFEERTEGMTHYVIVAGDYLIETFQYQEPVIEVLEKK